MKCPRCGNGMRRIGGVTTFNLGERTCKSSYWYKCDRCGERRIVVEIKTKDGMVVDVRME